MPQDPIQTIAEDIAQKLTSHEKQAFLVGRRHEHYTVVRDRVDGLINNAMVHIVLDRPDTAPERIRVAVVRAITQ